MPRFSSDGSRRHHGQQMADPAEDQQIIRGPLAQLRQIRGSSSRLGGVVNATLASSSPSPVETPVHRIRALMEHRRFSDALAPTEPLPPHAPDNLDVLDM